MADLNVRCLAVILAIASQGVAPQTLLSVRGRVHFEGVGPAPKLIPEARIVLIPATLDREAVAKLASGLVPITTVPGGAIGADGRFVVEGVAPGRYFINATLIPGRWHVVSMTWDGKDVAETGIEIGSRAVPDLIVTYSDRQTGVAGSVRLPPDRVASSFTVVAFNSSRGVLGARQTARPGPDGNWMLDLPPGRYFIAAVAGYELPMGTPAFLETLRSSAVEITLADGERKIQDLMVSP